MIRSKLWAADLNPREIGGKAEISRGPLEDGRSAATRTGEFVEVDLDRLSDITTAMGRDGDRAVARFARGCRCFGIEHDGGLVAYGWLSTATEWIGELNVAIWPAEGEAYVWNCFTLEPHRRRGRYRALLEGIVLQASVEGLHRLWIGSVEDPAEKADADAGFAPVLLFEVTRLLGLRLLRARPAGGAHPGLVQTARQRLRIGSGPRIGPAVRRVH